MRWGQTIKFVDLSLLLLHAWLESDDSDQPSLSISSGLNRYCHLEYVALLNIRAKPCSLTDLV
jgi:hypothetical protein